MQGQIESAAGIHMATFKPEVDPSRVVGKLDEVEVEDLGGPDYTPLPSMISEWEKPAVA